MLKSISVKNKWTSDCCVFLLQLSTYYLWRLGHIPTTKNGGPYIGRVPIICLHKFPLLKADMKTQLLAHTYFCCLNCKKYNTRFKYIVLFLCCLLFNDCNSELDVVILHSWNHRLGDATALPPLKTAQCLLERMESLKCHKVDGG